MPFGDPGTLNTTRASMQFNRMHSTQTVEVVRKNVATLYAFFGKRRIKDTLDLLETLPAWGDEMLRLDAETLTKGLRLGARIKKLLGREPLSVPDLDLPPMPEPDAAATPVSGP